MSLIEGLVREIWTSAGFPPPDAIPHMTFAEAMERFGTDKPDVRYGLELQSVNDPSGACLGKAIVAPSLAPHLSQTEFYAALSILGIASEVMCP